MTQYRTLHDSRTDNDGGFSITLDIAERGPVSVALNSDDGEVLLIGREEIEDAIRALQTALRSVSVAKVARMAGVV